MFGLLGIVAFVGTLCQIVKEESQPVIPAENLAHKELMHKDQMSGISSREFSRNLANGKYKLTKTYPEPHRDERGRIIIENYKLYREDIDKHGISKAHEWKMQGKYNLTPEELEKQKEEFAKEWEYLYSLRK